MCFWPHIEDQCCRQSPQTDRNRSLLVITRRLVRELTVSTHLWSYNGCDDRPQEIATNLLSAVGLPRQHLRSTYASVLLKRAVSPVSPLPSQHWLSPTALNTSHPHHILHNTTTGWQENQYWLYFLSWPEASHRHNHCFLESEPIRSLQSLHQYINTRYKTIRKCFFRVFS
ncbi:unnamed protein product [Medioppia subpectinata]|uniref:Uncharacterized protein n=1 Tax=Medioppia subpectinata TaxID=1979941 RepID=A0A7R9Q1B3_9ACAR|nr:unnamed protein product [Medioppia subpectinata]CAG2108910.1 unnamed protein product [Medioppia subpectinata]